MLLDLSSSYSMREMNFEMSVVWSQI